MEQTQPSAPKKDTHTAEGLLSVSLIHSGTPDRTVRVLTCRMFM